MDRLVGFEISPILWRKIKTGLSAGRVQSVAVRLTVEREDDIRAFDTKSSFRVTATFHTTDGDSVIGTVSKDFDDYDLAKSFLEAINGESFTVKDIEKKESRRSSSAPFTTSTLQQEASSRLGYSVTQTMSVAQRLYEAGHITYMRTDSTHLSKEAISSISSYIKEHFGDEYYHLKNYASKASAQEAHEAIRPANFNQKSVTGDQEDRLYQLIWKRTVASQMKPAVFDVTKISIQAGSVYESFLVKGETLTFDGFMKVYRSESTDESSQILPVLNVGDTLEANDIQAKERFSRPPARFTEASLVKKLEELGIGRPSTYAPTISTIQKREYVEKRSQDPVPRTHRMIQIQNQVLEESSLEEMTGQERNKLFPTDMGSLVTKWLEKHFPDILDYGFTAKVEEDLDSIATDGTEWTGMLKGFSGPFRERLEDVRENSERESGERQLGTDPDSGEPVLVRMGKFGPIAQIGTEKESMKFAGLLKTQSLSTITLEEALKLFEYPRVLGEFEGENVLANIGRYGPYVQHKKSFFGLKDTDLEVDTIQLNEAIELIEKQREEDKNKIIHCFDEEDPKIEVLNGRYGPYICIYEKKKRNIKIPKDTDPKTLTRAKCIELGEAAPKTKRGRRK